MTGPGNKAFLPTTVKEMKVLGWNSVDVVLFSADAYVDHPSFGAAVIARVMEHKGLRVAVVPQPNWQDDLRDFKKFGKPNLFFAISGGAMDSMVNHYTANKRKRSNDAYTPGGETGKRPDRAVLVYSNILKTLFPDVPLIIGGIEASLRRLAHYDYWSGQMKPSVLIEAKADFLIYGMGERPIFQVIDAFRQENPIKEIRKIKQICYVVNAEELKNEELLGDSEKIPSFTACCQSKKHFTEAFLVFECNTNQYNAKRLAQQHDDCFVVVNPPGHPLESNALDDIYALPFTRLPHPRYRNKKAIPAYEMIKNSITIHRGCFGGCSFCAIHAHQGRFITSRSEASVLKEIEDISEQEGFDGVISDLGGPSANMYQMGGENMSICYTCKRSSCIYPSICDNLNTGHKPLTELYKKAQAVMGVKHLFVGSGIRYDLLLKSHNKKAGKEEEEYIKQVILHHVSGRLKVAPEHTEDVVLQLMRKPSFSLFEEFLSIFKSVAKKGKRNYELVPYFMSNHPGCTENNMMHLAVISKKLNLKLEQVQDYTPVPMTRSSVVFYTERIPGAGKKVYVPGSIKERQEQNRFFFWYKPENKGWFSAKLKSASIEN